MRGQILLTARQQAKLTLKELAAKTGTSFQHLSRLERNQCGLTLATLRRIDRVLHLPTQALVRLVRCEEDDTL